MLRKQRVGLFAAAPLMVISLMLPAAQQVPAAQESLKQTPVKVEQAEFHASPTHVLKPKPEVKPKRVKHVSRKKARPHHKKVLVSRVLPGNWRTESVRICIRQHESGGNYQAHSAGNPAWGAYQFYDSTWHHVTGLYGHASQYSASVQDAAFRKIQRMIQSATIMQQQFTTYRYCH